MLTTTDNPYNPWTEYDQWYAWDESAGYHTTSYLARLCNTIAGMPEDEEEIAMRLAIASILEANITGNYVLVPQPAA